MELQDAVNGRRTIRRFKREPVGDSLLASLVDAARRAPCGGNMQRLRYFCCSDPAACDDKILPMTAWAAHVSPRRTPERGCTSPTAFLAVAGPANPNAHIFADAGAAIQSILLTAFELGLGACWLGSFDKDAAARIFGLEKDMEVLYLVALGFPDESPVMEDIAAGESCKYYLDCGDVLHVPKLTVESIFRKI